jgi:predicted nucleic acid-binding protein
LEVANVLLVGERKKRLVPAQSLRFVELLQNLPITLSPDVRPPGVLLGLAREQGLSSYDASYLDLAIRTGLPLASLDGDLLAAADRFGVARFEA